MPVKVLLFVLFLFISLVWVGAFYLHSGSEISDFGLLWTAIGLAALLAFIILTRVAGWWRARAKVALKPAAPPVPQVPVHEDDAALADLIVKANSALAKMPASAEGIKKSLFSFPLYLLLGPEGSGKTSTFLNSGLQPQLLADHENEPLSPVSTRLCNFWLARDAVFIEFSGKAFTGELGRWKRLLETLRGEKPLPLWKRLWLQPPERLAVRGIMVFSDVKDLLGASSDTQRFERNCRDSNQRLSAVAETFGVPVPVYQVISKCDAIPFFNEFFRRLPDSDANQVLGCTLPVQLGPQAPDGEAAETEVKRLTNSFRLLYQALARRRLRYLAHEPERNIRPAIYEFPRELKRVRTPLIQLLTEVFRRNPLRVEPILRGYYFTARRRDETGGGFSQNYPDSSNTNFDASQVFHGDATRIFKPDDQGGGPVAFGHKPDAFRWIFTSDLFHEVVLRDSRAAQSAPIEPRLEQYRKWLYASAGVLCVVLCGIFLYSWGANRDLLRKVEAAASVPVQRRDGQVTLATLHSLDEIRAQVQDLRRGSPLFMHWGLYSGNRIMDAARRAYFAKFQESLLNDLNGSLVEGLVAAPATATGDDRSTLLYDQLKAHVMISSGRCKAEPAFLSKVLKNETNSRYPATAGSRWQDLARRQIDFYASELEFGNPCRIVENAPACDRARRYLQSAKGVEAVYRAILANAEKSVPKPQKLKDIAPNYMQVLSGPEINPAFTPDGWRFVEKASRDRTVSVLEPCLSDVGSNASADPRAIQQLFIRDYGDQWRKYIAAFSVVRYSGPKDAARKLTVLSDHKSPLLALFALTSNSTNFPLAAETNPLENVPILGNLVKKGEKTANKVQDLRHEMLSILSMADVTRAFQPVSWVVPAGSDTWVGEKNNAYIESLAQLARSMQEIADGKTGDPATIQTANQNVEKAFDAARQIAKGFKAVRVEGVDGEVQRLLNEPIENVRSLIPVDARTGAVSRINGEARGLCQSLKGTLQKFPLQSSSSTDATVADFASVFAPGSGSIWKFAAASLGELVIKEGPTWRAKDPSQATQITTDMLAFLNRAQTISDVFFQNGSPQPQFTYILRPRADSNPKNSTLELNVDGQNHVWSSIFQKQFVWPAAPGMPQGAVGRIHGEGFTYPFASRSGLWGIFRVFIDAEPRPASGKLLEWKYAKGSNGNPEPIDPPVRLELVEFPRGIDIFQPKFFQALRCPATAAQASAR